MCRISCSVPPPVMLAPGWQLAYGFSPTGPVCRLPGLAGYLGLSL